MDENQTRAPPCYAGLNANNTPANEPCETSFLFFFIYGPCYGLVCGLGLVGNTLSFAILHKYSNESVATYLLKALALVDNAFLATSGFVQIFSAMIVYFQLRGPMLDALYEFTRLLIWPVVHMVQMGTVWMVVLIAVNRYIAVCRPLQAATLCSTRNVRRQMIFTFICVVLYTAPRFAENHFIQVETSLPNCTISRWINVGLGDTVIYKYLYQQGAYFVLVFLVPLSTLIVLNGHLVRELKRAQLSARTLRRQTLIGRSSSEENNITFVMIIIIVSFIVCETPAAISNGMMTLVSEHQMNTCSTYQSFVHISNLLNTTNSSLNFVIYCLFRRQFQQELRAMMCRRGGGRAGSQRGTVLLRALHQSVSEAHAPARGSTGETAENGRVSALYK